MGEGKERGDVGDENEPYRSESMSEASEAPSVALLSAVFTVAISPYITW